MKEYRSTKAKKIEFSSLVLVGPHWIIFVPLDCTKKQEHKGSYLGQTLLFNPALLVYVKHAQVDRKDKASHLVSANLIHFSKIEDLTILPVPTSV